MLHCSTDLTPAGAISEEIASIVEALGLATRQGGRLVAGGPPRDPARARLAMLGLQLGLIAEELAELLALYDAAPAEERGLGRFVELLVYYQRFVTWRATAALADAA